MPNYAFIDLVKDSGAPYYYEMDVLREFDAIQSKAYGRDYDLHVRAPSSQKPARGLHAAPAQRSKTLRACTTSSTMRTPFTLAHHAIKPCIRCR